MATTHFIAARVSPETKSRLRALAEQRQLNESALLKQIIELTLDGAAVRHIHNPDEGRRVARAARLYVRLAPEDQLLLVERAGARGMAAATYISVLVRAHMRHLSPLPEAEFTAFRQSIAELGAIGRNLNQIVRTVQQGGSATGPRREDVVAMLRICTGLRDHFKATLLANLRSWQVGHES